MRNSFLDTSKACLIFLVVLGHFLERLLGWTNSENSILLATIYSFHMPAFIFISGLLFKEKNWLKNIIFFLSLYLPFQFLYSVFDGVLTGEWHWPMLNKPFWILWYLMGMMGWTWYCHLFKSAKLSIGFAILLSVLVGYSPWNNYLYSVGRMCVFLPFFVIGHHYGTVILNKVSTLKWSPYVGGIIFLGMILTLVEIQPNRFWLYGSLSYAQLQVNESIGCLIRLGLLFFSSLGILAFLCFCQLFKHQFMRLGQHTLPVYLLHGFVVILIARLWSFHLHLYLSMMICVILSILTCWFLQSSVFDRGLRKLSLWLMIPTENLWKSKKIRQ